MVGPERGAVRFHTGLVSELGGCLLGRRLYETMLVWDTEEFSDPVMAEFAEIWRPLEKIVFSTTLTSVEGSNRLATGTLEEEIAALPGSAATYERLRDVHREATTD